LNAFFWSLIGVWKHWSNYIFNMALHWKCTSVNAFIPQWNFKRMHSILNWNMLTNIIFVCCSQFLVNRYHVCEGYLWTDISCLWEVFVNRNIMFVRGICEQIYHVCERYLWTDIGKHISIKNWMHSFEVSLGYESVDRSTFTMKRHVENEVRSTLSYPNETSKECIQFL
jgi:hypothetical protein